MLTSMFLNLHERWLLLVVGVHRRERREFFATIAADGQPPGDVDIAAQVGGYTMVKRSVRTDLPALFDHFNDPSQRPAHGIAYGDRRYRRQVVVAAALHQAGVSPRAYQTGLFAGYRKLSEFTANQ
jgi:SLT domain-containing protein